MSEYILKNDPLAINRIKKLAKSIIDNSKADRKLARETYDYFKLIVDHNNPEDSKAAQKCMVDCLKLMQTSKTDSVKIVVDMLKKSSTKTPEEKSDWNDKWDVDQIVAALENEKDE